MVAFALGMEGLIPEAIREMESLRSKHEIELGVGMALLYFHGKAKMVDRYECCKTVAIYLQCKQSFSCCVLQWAFSSQEAFVVHSHGDVF